VRFQEVVALHPHPTAIDRGVLVECVEECLDCGATCTACADASLSEDDVGGMVRVIRLCADCADICEATARVVVRQTVSDPAVASVLLEACAAACIACAEECERHAAHHEHCRVSAEVCRRCRQACDDLQTSLR
jgi:uncharacterized membrane protein